MLRIACTTYVAISCVSASSAGRRRDPRREGVQHSNLDMPASHLVWLCIRCRCTESTTSSARGSLCRCRALPMEIGHQQTRVQGNNGHPSEPARPASPPAPTSIVAAAKEYQDEQYNDEERGVIHAAPPSISPLK